MTRNPFRRTGAEHVLDGATPWPPDLARLVAAARAPAGPGELAGEDAVVAAFRAHAAADAAATGPVRLTVARLLAVKIATGVAVLVAGGYAVAAATGTVPSPPFLPSRAPTPAVTTPGAETPTEEGTTERQPPAIAPSAGTTRRPVTSYTGLCRAYVNGSVGNDTPPMRDLVAAAGGADQVPRFCAAAGVPSPMPPNGEPKPSKETKPPRVSTSPKNKPLPSPDPPLSRSPHPPAGDGPAAD